MSGKVRAMTRERVPCLPLAAARRRRRPAAIEGRRDPTGRSGSSGVCRRTSRRRARSRPGRRRAARYSNTRPARGGGVRTRRTGKDEVVGPRRRCCCVERAEGRPLRRRLGGGDAAVREGAVDAGFRLMNAQKALVDAMEPPPREGGTRFQPAPGALRVRRSVPRGVAGRSSTSSGKTKSASERRQRAHVFNLTRAFFRPRRFACPKTRVSLMGKTLARVAFVHVRWRRSIHREQVRPPRRTPPRAPPRARCVAFARGATGSIARAMPSVPPSAPSTRARAARDVASAAGSSSIAVPPRATLAARPPPPERLGSARTSVLTWPDPAPRPAGASVPGRRPGILAATLGAPLLLLLLLPLARAESVMRARSPRDRTNAPRAPPPRRRRGSPRSAPPRGELRRPRSDPRVGAGRRGVAGRLRRDCDPDAGTFIGDRGWHSEPWDAIATFAGTKSEWTTLACSSDAPTSDVSCDGDGRVRRFAPKRLALRCASLPPEFAALTRLLELEIEGQYRLADWPTMDAFLAPAVDLAALETLRVKTSSVRGALPDLCGAGLLPHLRTLDIETPLETLGGEGLACLSNLETLRLAGLARSAARTRFRTRGSR